MSLQSRKRTILFKTESVYGTDPTPTGSANAVQVTNLNASPLNANIVKRNLIRPYYGNSDQLLSDKHGTIDFEVELAGSGVRGLAPAWAPILLACAFAETLNTGAVTSITRSSAVATLTKTAHGFLVGDKILIAGADQSEYNGQHVVASVPTADTLTFAVSGTPVTPATGTITYGVSAVYAPISSSLPSATIYFNNDGVLHKLTGCRGNAEFTVNVRNIPVIKFSFIGLYNDPADVAAPSVDYSGYQKPKVANTSNTTGFSLFGYSGVLEQFGLNMSNQVEYITRIGLEQVALVDREPAGTVLIEAPTIAGHDFFSDAAAGTTGAFSITHGTANGNKITIAAPRVSLGNPAYQDSQGTQMLSIPIVMAPSSGNDEISITAA
jgi:hypothetical protein